jgi:hypothetical protein
VTTKYLAKFQSPRAITRPKIIGPEQNVHLICNLSLYTHILNIKSISQSIAKKSGDNCFISELRTWIALYITNLVCYTYFHWFFSPECIFGKQTGYIIQSPKKIKTWTTKHYASLNQWYNTE